MIGGGGIVSLPRFKSLYGDRDALKPRRRTNNVDIHTVVSAYSGIGGLDLGVRAAIPTRTICYIEREITCARVLAQRVSEGLLDEAPIYSDVKSFPAELFAGKVDILIGGFPCQPFSHAGKQEGSEDERNLWPDTLRLIRTLRPQFVFLENVPALISNEYFGTILGDLAESGFDAEWGCFTASEIGASHRRERVFILAYTESERHGRGDCIKCGDEQRFIQSEESGGSEMGSEAEGCDSKLADSEHQRPVQPEPQGRPRCREGLFEGRGDQMVYSVGEFPHGPDDPAWGDVLRTYPELAPATCKHEPPARPQMSQSEPAVRRMDDAGEVEDRVASLMALGNAVVPHQAELAFKTLASRI